MASQCKEGNIDTHSENPKCDEENIDTQSQAPQCKEENIDTRSEAPQCNEENTLFICYIIFEVYKKSCVRHYC